MEKRYMERLVGKYCKIVTREPGEERTNVVTGTLEDVKDGFIFVDSYQGLGCLRIDTVVAIKPGKKRKRFKDDEAMAGIGVLIVFISMVLIGAVAAVVLIDASSMIKEKAENVVKESVQEISTGVTINDIVGYTNANKTRISYLAFSISPRAGTKDMDLSLLTLTVLYDQLNSLTLNESLVSMVNTDNKSVFDTPISSGSSYTIMDNTTATKFGVIAIHDPDGSVVNTNGINRGDRIYIIVNLTALIPDQGGLPARGTISGGIQPETGTPGIYDTTAPATFTRRIIDFG